MFGLAFLVYKVASFFTLRGLRKRIKLNFDLKAFLRIKIFSALNSLRNSARVYPVPINQQRIVDYNVECLRL